MNTVAECTAPEKILLAAYKLEELGQSPFGAESLIVAAWQDFPRTFGLKGYAEQFPDSNRVLSCIMGERGLARRGWLSKMGQKLYALTREGRQVVIRLQAGGEPPETELLVKISKDQEKHLLTLLSSSAVKKFEDDRREEFTFADACRFWGITENLNGEALTARLDRLGAVMADVDRLVGDGNAELSTGRVVSKDDMNLLHAVHEYLEDRFGRHLTLLKSRAGRS